MQSKTEGNLLFLIRKGKKMQQNLCPMVIFTYFCREIDVKKLYSNIYAL